MIYGIVIVFLDNEYDLERSSISELFHLYDDVKFCLVNNGSVDETHAMLTSLMAEYKERIKVLDIKKTKNFKAAVKAGIRFLEFEYELLKVGYIAFEDINDIDHFIQKLKNEDVWELRFKQAVSQEIGKYNLGRDLFRNACSLTTLFN